MTVNAKSLMPLFPAEQAKKLASIFNTESVPQGVDTDFQFNNSGAFGGSTNFQFDAPNGAVRGLVGLTRGIELFNTSDITTNTERLRMFWSANVVTISTDTQGAGTQREMRIGTYASGIAQNYFRMFGTGGSVSCHLQLASSGAAGIVGFNVVPSTYNASSGTQTVMQIQGVISQTGTAGFNCLLLNPTITTGGTGANWLFQVQNSSVFRAGIATNGQLRLSSGSGQVDFSPIGNSLIISPGASSSALTAVQILNGTMATNSSGTYVGLSVAGAMVQSSTAGYTGFLVNITETATGSGAKKLIDTQIGGVTNFSILNNGRIQYIAGNTAATVGAAGGAAALPATPTGYALIDIGGTAFKIPYYAN